MGMTMDHETADSLLAPYLLDALDPEVDDTAALEAHLATCTVCQTTARELRSVVDELAEVAASGAVAPAGLREQTLAAARDRRPGAPLPEYSPAEVHLIEASRLSTLLASITADQWSRPVGPAFPNWTVHDLTAHLASTEGLLAEALGADRFVPETETQPEPRAHAAVARHRRLDPTVAVAEYEAAAGLVQRAVASLGPAHAEADITWWDLPLTVGTVLIQRAFETWTHADDIRAARHEPAPLPSPGSLHVMSATAVETIPLMLAAGGTAAEGRRARIELTGPGGGTYDIALGLEAEGDADAPPDVTLRVDVIDFCKAIGDRLAPADLPHRTSGDLDLGAQVVAALPALAVL
jgi:uncharacterized protein (TIGR03083 family)